MANFIPPNILDDILGRVDIVELISGYFPLKRAGRNFKANCPFHHEKTASFMVSPQRQIYHCFGCGKGGNAISFLTEYERMDFVEVVKLLAGKSGVVLPERSFPSKKDGFISSLYKLNELAAGFYEKILNSHQGVQAQRYLLNRKTNVQTAKFFRLGLSLDKWDGLLNYLRSKNISLALIEKSGLVCSRSQGGYYDRFRKRLIFPIFDIKNRVVAFGARILEGSPDQAKYINSPESPVYVKGRHLYGFNFTREHIRQSDCAIVVEGYFDCISVYQAGIKNVVASLGTSLTLEQIKLLKRFTHNVVMIYDSDQAGQEATLRSLDIFIQEEMNVRVALLSVGFDPDSFLRKFGPEEFKKRIDNAKGLFDYKLDALTSRFDRNKPEGKAAITNHMFASLSYLKNAVLKSEYIRRLSQELDIKEEALIIELKKIKNSNFYDFNQSKGKVDLKFNPTERLLINLLLRETDLIAQLKNVLVPGDFQDARIAKIFSLMCDLKSEGKSLQVNRLIDYFDDRESASLVTELLTADEFLHEEPESILSDCVNRIKKQRLDSRSQSLQKQIKAAEMENDQGQLNRLIAEFRDLQRLRIE